MLVFKLTSEGQQLKLINLNTHDTIKTDLSKKYYFGVDGQKGPSFGSIKALADSCIEADGKRIELGKLWWLSEHKRVPRPGIDKMARAALSLYGLSILVSGLYYADRTDLEALKLSAIYGAGLGLPAGLWLWLRREPDYNLRGSWIAIIER